MGDDVEVRDNRDRMRYEVRTADGEVAGYATYARRGGTVVINHTVIADGHAGKGYGSTLARGTLEDLRTRGLAVVPVCEFFAGWMERNPEFADLVNEPLAAEHAAEVEAGASPS
jgi:predicted GNAT family acetyltransferase